MLKTTEIPGQYWFYYSRPRHKSLEKAITLSKDINGSGTSTKRDELAQLLQPVCGYKEASELAVANMSRLIPMLEEIEMAYGEEKNRLRDRIKELAQIEQTELPAGYGQTEIQRNAVFNLLAGTGIIMAQTLLDVSQGSSDKDWESIVTEVVQGANLRDYVDPSLISIFQQETVDRRVEEATKYLRLSSSQETDLRKKIPTSWEKDGKYQAALASLLGGSITIGHLGKDYRGPETELLYALAQRRSRHASLLTNKYPMHTGNTRHAMVLRKKMNGEAALEAYLVKDIGFGQPNVWAGNMYTVLDPVEEIPAETVGEYIGRFIFGPVNIAGEKAIKYFPRNVTRDYFLELLGRAGTLEQDPHIKPPKRHVKVRYTVPVQYPNVARHAINLVKAYPGSDWSYEVAKSAMRMWMTERYQEGPVAGEANIILAPRDEENIREFARITHLELDQGEVTIRGRAKLVHCSNPEVVGYTPPS